MPLTRPLHSFAYALDYLNAQVADVSDDDFARSPIGAANHPAWIIGHLTLTCQMLAGAVGVEPWLPSDYESRFTTGSSPGQAYESKQQSLARLADAQKRIVAAVGRLSDAQLDQPFPDPAYSAVFPTLGHAIVQVLVGHTSFHVGQISVWRKAMNLPRMARGFE